MKNFKNFMRNFANDVNATIMGIGCIFAIVNIIGIILLVQNPYYNDFVVYTMIALEYAFVVYAFFYIACVMYDNVMTHKEETIATYNDIISIVGEEPVKAAIGDKKTFEAFLRNEIARREVARRTIACQMTAEPCLVGERLEEVENEENRLLRERHMFNEMLNNISYLKYVR